MTKEDLSIVNKTRYDMPRLPFALIKDDILGKDYSLSVAYVDEKTSKSLNNKWRGKNNPTNILSFSLSKKNGEIILCPAVIKNEAPNFQKTFPEFLGFLVIHGMLHLKGLEHSSTMEKAEEKYDQKYFHRNRRWLPDNTSRSRRILKGRKKS